MSADPDWLVTWQERQLSRGEPAVTPKLRPAAPLRPDRLGFTEPNEWPDDGGQRREVVLDHDCLPPRVVRRVGGFAACAVESRSLAATCSAYAFALGSGDAGATTT